MRSVETRAVRPARVAAGNHRSVLACGVVECVVWGMGYPTKVQLIKRAKSEQWYVNVPSAIAQAMQFARGETVEWSISDKRHLVLTRHCVPPDAVVIKEKPRKAGR